MKEVKFQKDGEQLSICIEFGDSQIASYRLRLWENGTTVLDTSENNQNLKNACYNLPFPAKDNDERFVQCETSIVSSSQIAGEQYSVTLVFKQGDREIDRMTGSGPMNGGRARPELRAKLGAV